MANKNQLQKIRQNLLAIRSGATPSEMSERMRDLCNANGYDPVYELVELIRNGERVESETGEVVHIPISVKDQVAIHKEMLKYIYPTLKSVDIQGEINATVNVTVKQYGTEALTDKMKEAIDADFSDVGERIVKNVANIRHQKKAEEDA